MRSRFSERRLPLYFLWCSHFACDPSVLWANGFESQKTGFLVHFNGDTISHRVFGVYVLPGEKLTLAAMHDDPECEFQLVVSGGIVTRASARSWQWQAPGEKGLVQIKVLQSSPADFMLINAFVMVPFERMKGEYLDTYRIGSYPLQRHKNSPVYESPRGFVEVTEANQDAWISPHFRLRQFLCKQAGPYPKYVVLNVRLLLLLEHILERTNAAGYQCRTFHIMSGYRTPFYNRAIGNVKYSSHQYGLAADFFIDENPQDDMMDDLNGDGRSDLKDAALVHDLIVKMSGEPWFEQFRGGLAKYDKTSSRGPFIHVDVRGSQARWGK